MSAVRGYYRFPTVHGDTVVFVAEDDLWGADLSGGPAHRLTANPGAASWPVLSPSGKHVAFTSKDEGQPDVWVFELAGGPARRVTYFGSMSRPVAWDGEDRLVVATDWQQPFPGWLHLVSVELSTGVPTPLGLGPAGAWSSGSKGPGVVLGRVGRDPAQWKRYRGGRRGRLYVDRRGDGEFAPLTELDGNIASPMWIGNRIHFLSDHEGHGNLYSVTPTGRNLERHTHHQGFYARNASTDGRTIVYHHGADLRRFDVRTGDDEKIDVTLPSAQPQRLRRFQSPGKHLESIELHPEGHSVAIVARGSATTMALWEGAPIAHGSGPQSRDRLVGYVGKGDVVAGVTDEPGEDALFVEPADGSGPRQIISGDFGRIRASVFSPAGVRRAVIENHRHEVIVVNLETGKARTLHHSPHLWALGSAWSPDGTWIAFGAMVSPTTSALFVANARTGRVRQVTSGDFFDVDPSFSSDGQYLMFLSSRTFDPVADSIFHDYSFPSSYRPYLIPLESSTVSPFAAEQRSPRSPGGPPKPDNAKPGPAAGDEKRVTRIDFAGIASRVVAFPVPVGRYRRVLAAGPDRALFLSFPVQGATAHDHRGGRLEAWDFGAGKVEPVAEGVSDFTVSADGATLAYLAERKLRVVPSALKGGDKNGNDKPGRESGWVDLSRVRITVDPPSEWSQMFHEAWRLQRDYFWREDMADVNWKAVLRRFEPLIGRVASRSEFSDLMWSMQGELGTSHAYEMGGDYRPEPTWRQGSLGADLRQLRSGKWVVDSIPSGDSWSESGSSPIGAVGLKISPGDRVLAVDGIELGRGVTPYSALANRAEAAVRVQVQRGRTKPRTVVVKALRSETALRYRHWVEANRRRVHEASQGTAGYLHIPDMGPAGFAEFHRGWRAEVDRDGLVIDVRFNRGGNVSHLLLQKLVRQRIGFRVTRWNPPRAVPRDTPTGLMVALTNEMCGSDGDIFSHTFKLYGLGPLIGVRTWGGVTGIWPQQSLVDGTVTTQPEFGSWFNDVGFGLENYGTDPDIEVENLPQHYAAGVDEQLERGIKEIMEQIDSAEPFLPDFGSHPSMRAPRSASQRRRKDMTTTITAAARAVDASKIYGEGDTAVHALRNIDVEFIAG